MDYQLVFKFRRAVLPGDMITKLETELTQALEGSATLDGHNVGTRDLDLFILTQEPVSTFRRSKPVLEQLGLLDRVAVAHRFVGGSSFTVIWPLRWGRKFSA